MLTDHARSGSGDCDWFERFVWKMDELIQLGFLWRTERGKPPQDLLVDTSSAIWLFKRITMAVTGTLSGTIQLTDNQPGDVAQTKALSFAYTGSFSTFNQSATASTSGATVTLPNGAAQFFYLKNLSTAVGGNLTVAWTPKSGSSETAAVLSPGSALILTETDANNGITGLTLTAAAAGVTYELIAVS